jgi:hypothetical protein
MRKALGESLGDRKKFSGIFVRLGKKKNHRGYTEETVLIRSITDMEDGKVVADHLWFAYTKGFQQVSLDAGARIEFEARVKKYAKGYRNAQYKIDSRTKDYKLSHPTKISLSVR